ncbi:hypothetical protein BHE74_00012077 [Ensete ventricosum]|nr:hypothetical protein BHE74_00012077 [Ensete ventricosum]
MQYQTPPKSVERRSQTRQRGREERNHRSVSPCSSNNASSRRAFSADLRHVDFSCPSTGVLDEIRFFHDYAHHVATSDSTGEMHAARRLPDLSSGRVHVILNGVDEDKFAPDVRLGAAFRKEIGLPGGATLVMGVAGRLVMDKGCCWALSMTIRAASEDIASSCLVRRGTRYEPPPPLRKLSPGWCRGTRTCIWWWRDRDRTTKLHRTFLTTISKEKAGLITDRISTATYSICTLFTISSKPVPASKLKAFYNSVGRVLEPHAEAAGTGLDVDGSRWRRRGCRASKGPILVDKVFAATEMALAYERLFVCVKNETHCSYEQDCMLCTGVVGTGHLFHGKDDEKTCMHEKEGGREGGHLFHGKDDEKTCMHEKEGGRLMAEKPRCMKSWE